MTKQTAESKVWVDNGYLWQVKKYPRKYYICRICSVCGSGGIVTDIPGSDWGYNTKREAQAALNAHAVENNWTEREGE